jgi:TolA-binding protein
METANPNLSNPSRPSNKYLNSVLTVIAVMLGLLATERFFGSSATGQTAMAAPSEETDTIGMVNAADQRKQIIAELKTMNSKLDKLQGSIKSPMPVKVLEMPAIRVEDKK